MFIPKRPNEEAVEAAEKVDGAEFQELFKKCVQAFLVLGQDLAPIKKQDLNRVVFPGIHYKSSAAIIQYANKELIKTYGMRIYELEDRTRYLLVNTKPPLFTPIATERSDSVVEENVVLFFVLIDIFVSTDEKVHEVALEESVAKPLELQMETMKSHLDNLVKKLYLRLEKNQESKFYSWGPRAYAEVEPEEFFNQFLQLAGSNSSESDWPELKKRIDKLKSVPNR